MVEKMRELQPEESGYKFREFGFRQIEDVRNYRRACCDGTSDGTQFYERKEGGKLFAAVANSPEYKEHVTEVEINLLRAINEALGKYLRNTDSMFVLGPDEKTKSEIIDTCFNDKDVKVYAADVSAYLVDEFCKLFSSSQKVQGVTGNRFSIPVLDEKEGLTGIFLGGTAGNMNDLGKLFSRFKSSHTKRAKLLVSYFTAPEPDGTLSEEQEAETIALYKNNTAIETFIMKGFEAQGFPPEKIEFEVLYEKASEGKPGMIKAGARAKESFSIHVGVNEYLHIKENDFLLGIPSRRFTKTQFAAEAKSGNCTVKKTFNGNGMALAVLEAEPKVKRNVRVHRKAYSQALVIVMLLSVVGFLTFKAGREEEKRRQKEYIESLYNLYGDEIERYVKELIERYGNTTISEEDITSLVVQLCDMEKAGLLRPQILDGSTDPYLHYPTPLERFLWINKMQLESKGLNIMPNKEILKFGEALSNTIDYIGEVLCFSDVDIPLPDYKGRVVGFTHGSNDLSYEDFRCGIKIHNGKEYFVIRDENEGAYVLESVNLEYDYYSYFRTGGFAGIVIRDVVERGGVGKLLAEQCTQMLGFVDSRSGIYSFSHQQKIVEYIIGMHAAGWDFSCMLGKTDYNYIWDRKELHDFVMSFIVKEYGGELRLEGISFEGAYERYDLKDLIDTIFTKMHSLNNKKVNLSEYDQNVVKSKVLALLISKGEYRNLNTTEKIEFWIEENIPSDF